MRTSGKSVLGLLLSMVLLPRPCLSMPSSAGLPKGIFTLADNDAGACPLCWPV